MELINAIPQGAPYYAQANKVYLILTAHSGFDVPWSELASLRIVLEQHGYCGFRVLSTGMPPLLGCRGPGHRVLLACNPDALYIYAGASQRGPAPSIWPPNVGGRGHVQSIAVPQALAEDALSAARILAWHPTSERRLRAFEWWLSDAYSFLDCSGWAKVSTGDL